MLTLPRIAQSQLNVRPIDWSVIPVANRARFLNPGEAEVLVALMRGARGGKGALDVIEFGCQNGRTAMLMLHNVPSIERYLGIDVPAGYTTACAVQRGEVPDNPGQFAYADSRYRTMLAGRGSHDLVSADLGMADVVFIDGDHSTQGVANDTFLARSVLRPGGLIIWHDYHNICDASGNPVVGVRDMLHGYAQDGARIVNVENTWIAFEVT